MNLNNTDQWYKLDNVSRVFLATHNLRDPRSLRVTAELTEEVDPELLQLALDQLMEVRPQLQVAIRRGFFWHYMEPCNARPMVEPDREGPCPVLYGRHYHGVLHFRVTWYRNRVNLDMFHALADGTGAISILQTLLVNYLTLRYPEQLNDLIAAQTASEAERSRNSYDQFYETENRKFATSVGGKSPKAYQLQGLRHPYNQTQFLEIHTDTVPLVEQAQKMGVSLTSYLGAQLILAIHRERSARLRYKPITISLPVNLRNYFPSETLRNFFNSVKVSHIFSGDETLESLAHEFEQQLRAAVEPENVRQQMNRFQNTENMLFTRLVPLFIKQPVVRYFTKKENKRVTAVLSNLGRVQFPQQLSQYISGITDFCSTEKLFITVTSYGNNLVLGVASAYASTAVLHRLLSQLQSVGADFTVYATEIVK